ncbi:hypothetical protein B0E43_13200 [Algoriphagus sp. A40]|nr:hypothetical protein B0E43_13200 [Algoriphagus sp. A40]
MKDSTSYSESFFIKLKKCFRLQKFSSSSYAKSIFKALFDRLDLLFDFIKSRTSLTMKRVIAINAVIGIADSKFFKIQSILVI